MAKENVRNILLAIIFVLILVVIALFIGRFTYSYLGAQVDNLLEGEGEVTATGDTIIFSKGNDLSINASTDNFYTGSGNLTDTTNPQVRLIASNKTNNASSTYSVGFRINENTFTYSTTNNTAELILTIRDENGNVVQSNSDTLSYVTVNGVSGFDITNKTGEFNVVIDHPISTTSSTTGITHTWTFTLTFINLSTDQSINENAILDIDVILQQNAIREFTTLTNYIISTYTDGSNGLYYHSSSLTNSAADNSYRYSGASPNNYVCFGSDAETCPSDNLYRIIGVFGDEVKLIKSTSYGNYAWNSSDSNVWNSTTKPSIRTTLNSTFYNSLDETWQDKIVSHDWKVNGVDWSSTYVAKQFYNDELENSASVVDKMKIGLLYVNEYGFAASSNYWTTAIYSYDNSTLRSNNWLYLGTDEWTISRLPSYDNLAYTFNANGRISNSGATYKRVIRPTFYLNSDVLYISGTGTSSDPIRIS